jgi:tetratricopeptide (TPR) repeat protein
MGPRENVIRVALMTDRELAFAARHALNHVDSESALGTNPLFARAGRLLPYEGQRATVLAALESLAPIDATDGAPQKQQRLHSILVRCDLRGEAHKCVIDALAVSRRQFYRERHEALVALAKAIERSLRRNPSPASTALGDAAEAIVEGLRRAGEFETVWREASALAAQSADAHSSVKLWIVASEAARNLGNVNRAMEAQQRAHAAAARAPQDHRQHSRRLWLAIGEMSMQWARGDCGAARDTFDQAVLAVPDERTLQGDAAILFGIMLGYAANIECDCGRWDQAHSLLSRAWRLAERGETLTTRPTLHRISGQIALRAHGDLRRAIADYHAALETDRSTGGLGSFAISATYYASALGEEEPEEALPYADYGLTIARRFYRGDRFTKLLLEAMPLLVRTRGAGLARATVADARTVNLELRDSLLLDLAEAKIAFYAGENRSAIEQAEAVAAQLARCDFQTWSYDAELVAIEAGARLGHYMRARRRLAEIADGLKAARADVRVRLQRLGTFLALPG